MTPEQYQRGYLLPPGCKDLIDVLRLQELHKQAFKLPLLMGQAPISGAEHFSQVWKIDEEKLKSTSSVPGVEPGFFLEVSLGPNVTVDFLASLLGRKPFQIVADLMELGVFASPQETVNFDDAAKVLRKYGLSASKRKSA